MEEFIQRILLLIVPMLVALTAHELAHAWVADRLGDPTPRMLGRLTINPLKHLDPIGTLAIFLTGMFGWAKPVPVNPNNFNDPAKAMKWVALAGPITNLCLAAIFAVIAKIMIMTAGAFVLRTSPILAPIFIMVHIGILLNVALGIFNMVPIPPLDGSKVLMSVLPFDKALAFSKIEPYGFIILIMLIYSGILHRVMGPIIDLTVGVLTMGI
ncbi:MAG: site-2 protease family protein [Proteobacteria bacterium]|nr:site-2 protease family protein [Pseudomonadota bacterium]